MSDTHECTTRTAGRKRSQKFKPPDDATREQLIALLESWTRAEPPVDLCDLGERQWGFRRRDAIKAIEKRLSQLKAARSSRPASSDPAEPRT